MYYLVKTEPSVYSITLFRKDGTTSWNGVRNPQAVLFLKAMKPGDLVLVYHTQGERAIVGLAEVLGNSRPDPQDAKSWLVDMKYIRSFDEPFVTITDIKKTGLFTHFRLVTQSRLSVMPVPDDVITYLESKGLHVRK
jgi:predicted RNA-binding protein with PUA-like domain